MTPRPGGVHRRLFRLLLLLAPGGFRERWGDEMTAFFLARLERARREDGVPGVTRLWLRTIVDIGRTAVAERGGRPNGEEGAGPWLRDLRHAARRLRRTPLFTVAAVAILAVGIGANVTAFGVVDALLFRPPPFEEPERLVSIYQDSDAGSPNSTSFPAYRDMAAMSDVFEAVAATSPTTVTWEAPDGPRQLSAEYATASYLPMLGLGTSRGRWLPADADRPGAAPLAVVSHRAWRSEMGSDPAVVGRTLRLNGQAVTVVGIGPPEFNGAGGALTVDLWLSISATVVGGPFRVANLDRRQDHWYDVRARLAPGVSLTRARQASDALAARLAADFPELNEGRGITVFGHDEVRFDPGVDGSLTAVGFAVLALVGMVLILACSNLANLLLVRGVSRTSEMAVRRALGAGRGQIARLFLLESLLLSALGGAVGLALAAWATGVIPRITLPLPGVSRVDVSLDHRVLLFSGALVLGTGLLFGLAPALRSTGADLAGSLREERRSASDGRRVSLLRNGLVAIQVSICLVLLLGTGLLTRSLSKIRGVDPGVDYDRVALMATNLGQGDVPQAEWPVVRDEILARVASTPGVDRVAITTRLPVASGGTTTTVVEDYEPPTGTRSVELPFAFVGPDYFEVMGIDRLAGRTFGPDDIPDAPRAVIVNRAAAERFWGGDAVGRRVRPQDAPEEWREVVGVVEDVKVSTLSEPPTPMIYFAATQGNPGGFVLVARTGGDPVALVPKLRKALADVSPSLPLTRLGPLSAHLGQAVSGPRSAATIMGVFSLFSLVLAALGIYAVVSFAVARRAAELGIRVALGAGRRRVVAMVVGESLLTVLLGIGVGLAVAVPLAPRLEGLLFEVGVLDPPTFLAGSGLLLAVAVIAAYVPARRAAQADPVDALRAA